MLAKGRLLFNTVRHLKAKQLFYQLLYRVKKPRSLAEYNGYDPGRPLNYLSFTEQPPVYRTAGNGNSFTFLNLQVDFGKAVNWSFMEHGRLWNYNLQYANYLLQEDVEVPIRTEWINSLYASLMDESLPPEPYPASLRSINTIRFLSFHKINDKGISEALHAELDFLNQRPEYHLLGNHLLENAFALMMGGAFFSKKRWVQEGLKILRAELKEQTLSDGAHFELSPMYHQIILFRLLELIDWYTKWEGREESFLKFLLEKATAMLTWLENISFANGDIPLLNDSAPGIAFDTPFLKQYAERLGLRKNENIKLEESGYRKFSTHKYECVVDVAEVGPSYQPGHAHADALSFILNSHNKPLITEWGTSTYQIGKRRSLERSTAAHNTLVIDGQDQSEVWGGFRVARRASVRILTDKEKELEAIHNGYHRQGYIHKRSFKFEELGFTITDTVEGDAAEGVDINVYFHIHPDRVVKLDEQKVWLDNEIFLEFTGSSDISLHKYNMADGFNQYKAGVTVKVKIQSLLTTNIRFN